MFQNGAPEVNNMTDTFSGMSGTYGLELPGTLSIVTMNRHFGKQVNKYLSAYLHKTMMDEGGIETPLHQRVAHMAKND